MQSPTKIATAVTGGLLALAACGTLLWPGTGGADNGDGLAAGRDISPSGPYYATGEFDRVRYLRQQGDILALGDILERARRYRRGRVLDTQLERAHDRYVYVVQMVGDGGQVWDMKFDASSGELLEDQQED